MLIKMKTIKIPYYLRKVYGRKTTRVSEINYEHIKADAELDKVSLGEAWHKRYGRLELQKVEITKRQGEITALVKEAKEPKKESKEVTNKEIKEHNFICGPPKTTYSTPRSWLKKYGESEWTWIYDKTTQGMIRVPIEVARHIPPTNPDKSLYAKKLAEKER